MATSPLPDREHKTAYVREMFDTIAGRYRLVNQLMTFGLDAHWRRVTIRRLLLPPGALVLDVASGTGELVRAGEATGLEMVGVDLSHGMLAAAGEQRGLGIQADAVALPFATGHFDGVVSGFAVRNFTDLDAVLGEIARVTRPGGRLALLEVDTPTLPLLAAGHRLWLRHGVPLLGGLVSDPDAYRYLPASLEYLPDAPELARRLRAAGYTRVERVRLAGGIVQVVTATRTGGAPLARIARTSVEGAGR